MADPFEDIFRQRLQQHKEAPPANGWQRISQTLQQDRRKPFAFWRWLSLALLPFATAVLVVKNLPQNTINTTKGFSVEATATDTQNRPINKRQTIKSGQAIFTDGIEVPNTLTKAQPGSNNTSTAAESKVVRITEKTDELQTGSQPTRNAQYANNLPNPVSVAGGISEVQNTEVETRFTATNQPEKALALNTAPKAKNRIAKKAKTGAGIAASTAVKQPGNNSIGNTPELGTNNTNPVTGIISKKTSEKDDEDETAAPETGKATAANQPGTGQSALKKPGSGAPAGASGSAGTATHAGVPKAPATQPGQPAASDSLTEGEARSEARLAGFILTDPALATIKTNLKENSEAPRLANAPGADKTAGRRWHFGAYVGSVYGMRRFSPNTTDQAHIQELSDKNQFYPKRLNYQAGLLAQHEFGKKLSLEAGLGALYYREQVEYKIATAPPASFSVSHIGNIMQTQPAYQYNTIKTNSTALYANLRMGAAYKALAMGSTGLQLTGGGLLNGRLSHSTSSNGQGPELGPEPARVQAGAYTGLRLQHTLPGGTSFALEPGFQYYFSSQKQQETKPYIVGHHAATLNLLFFLK